MYSSVPKSFVTLHVYFAESSGSRCWIFRFESVSSTRILILSDDFSSMPSLSHRNLSGGSPCDVAHETANLSPAFTPFLNSNGMILGTASSEIL